MIAILGILDILAGIWIAFLNYHIVGFGVSGLLAGYLIVKGIFFRDNFMSYLDIACGAFMLLLMLGVDTKIIYLIPTIYLLQKGIFSFF